MTEIRPLRWHDLPLVYRLAGHGVSFDARLSLTAGGDSVYHALLTGTGRAQIYVLRRPDGRGLGQLRFTADGRYASLAYIAPALEDGADETLWLALLDGLTAAAGQQGAVSLTAEVDETSQALEILRRAGFAAYARQDLWLRSPAPLDAATYPLRPASPADTSLVLSLYNMLSPGLIKHVEPPPNQADTCYLYESAGDVIGMAPVYRGSHRALIELYLLPEAYHEALPFAASVLAAVRAEAYPVVCRFRCYMGYPDSGLAKLGFHVFASQAVMVRHTVARVTHQAFKPLPDIEGGVPMATPIARPRE